MAFGSVRSPAAIDNGLELSPPAPTLPKHFNYLTALDTSTTSFLAKNAAHLVSVGSSAKIAGYSADASRKDVVEVSG